MINAKPVPCYRLPESLGMRNRPLAIKKLHIAKPDICEQNRSFAARYDLERV